MYVVYVFESDFAKSGEHVVIKHWPHGAEPELIAKHWPNRYMSSHDGLVRLKKCQRAEYEGNDYQVNTEIMSKAGQD